MNRRCFLELIGLAGSVAAAVTLLPGMDLGRALWVPGARKIFIPPTITANRTQSEVVNLLLLEFKSQLRLARMMQTRNLTNAICSAPATYSQLDTPALLP